MSRHKSLEYDNEIKNVDNNAKDWFRRLPYQTVDEYLAQKYDVKRPMKPQDHKK